MIAVSARQYEPLAQHFLTGAPTDWADHATVILDIPTGYALQQLDSMTDSQRRATIVITPATHPAYHDVLASYYIRQVVPATNDTSLAIMRALITDDAYQSTYQPRTGLTFTQARVLRAILRGDTTEQAAHHLSISVRTVNAHITNVCALLGVRGTTARAELVRQLLIGAPTQAPRTAA